MRNLLAAAAIVASVWGAIPPAEPATCTPEVEEVTEGYVPQRPAPADLETEWGVIQPPRADGYVPQRPNPGASPSPFVPSR